MENQFTFPYRRFSSDMFASSLVALLDENEIPFELAAEPESIGSVFIGQGAIPGVIVMVRPQEAGRVLSIEAGKDTVRDKPQTENASPEYDRIHPGWILGGYFMCFLGSPIAIIFGLHVFSA